ncbi:MAG: hypothetical protein ACM3JE_03440 [Betaproteobacteria bacterium]
MKKKTVEAALEGRFLKSFAFSSLSFRRRKITRRMAVILAASSAVLIVCGFFILVFIGFILNPIIPADVQIARTIDENKNLLESIDGVLAAGFGSNVHIDGINIYIDAGMTNIEAVPTQLGDFQVFLIRIDNTQPHDREDFLWCSTELKILPMETPGTT